MSIRQHEIEHGEEEPRPGLLVGARKLGSHWQRRLGGLNTGPGRGALRRIPWLYLGQW